MKYPVAKIIKPCICLKDADEIEICEPDLTSTLDFKAGMVPRSSGEFAGKGMYLPCTHDWAVVKDSQGDLVLICLKKKSDC